MRKKIIFCRSSFKYFRTTHKNLHSLIITIITTVMHVNSLSCAHASSLITILKAYMLVCFRVNFIETKKQWYWPASFCEWKCIKKTEEFTSDLMNSIPVSHTYNFFRFFILLIFLKMFSTLLIYFMKLKSSQYRRNAINLNICRIFIILNKWMTNALFGEKVSSS